MMRIRLAIGVLALVVALIAVVLPAAVGRAASVIPASEPRCLPVAGQSAAVHRAGLVVTFGDRHSELFCIAFTEDSISGLELLRRSGLALITSNSGGVCAINGEGLLDPSTCFPPCSGGVCIYWTYYQYTNGAWKYSSIGSSLRTIHDGDIDGWAYGAGGIIAGTLPAAPGEICPPPPPAPTETPIPSSTPEPATSVAPSVTSTPDPEVPTATKTRVAGTPTRVSGATMVPLNSTTPTDAAEDPPVSDVEAAARAPYAASTDDAEAGSEGKATQTPTATSTPTSTPTARSGVAVVAADVGKQNAARSERATTARSGGGATALWAFGAVEVALTALGGFAMYRRRRTGRSW